MPAAKAGFHQPVAIWNKRSAQIALLGYDCPGYESTILQSNTILLPVERSTISYFLKSKSCLLCKKLLEICHVSKEPLGKDKNVHLSRGCSFERSVKTKPHNQAFQNWRRTARLTKLLDSRSVTQKVQVRTSDSRIQLKPYRSTARYAGLTSFSRIRAVCFSRRVKTKPNETNVSTTRHTPHSRLS